MKAATYCLLAALQGPLFFATGDLPAAENLTELSLEELLDVEVTLVSKRPERLSHAPAAIHVINEEDIRRSGARSIPDLLRQAPGVQVAQLTSHSWGVSARGFNDVYANKLLVMIDGRTLYTPLFSGVFWDMQHTLLEDIERIEVVRGPGASLWGANAVNGVINIISKDAAETQGNLVTLGGGDVEQGFGAFRHGGRISDEAHFRIYGQTFDRAGFSGTNDMNLRDGIRVTQGGFRTDWRPEPTQHLTFQGDVYHTSLDQSYVRTTPPGTPPPPDGPGPFAPWVDEVYNNATGFNLLSRLESTAGLQSDWTFQAYFDETFRDTTIFTERRQTFDLDFQQTLLLGERHLLTWGAGHRITSDRIGETFDIQLDPKRRTDNVSSFFIQDEIAIWPEEFSLTLGTKLEHNDYTGFEVQPGIRGAWTPIPRQTVWASVARAVRTPSRAEHDIRINQPAPEGFPAHGPVSFFGNSGFGSEEMIAWELGYKTQPRSDLTLDLALFYNDYDKLRSVEPTDPEFRTDPPPPHFGFEADNLLYGESYGVEVAALWQAAEFWRWHASYSLLRLNLRAREDSRDPEFLGTAQDTEGRSPQHQAFLRSSFDLPHNWEWDTLFRFTDRLPAIGVESYLEMDLRLAWRPRQQLELSLTGLNLLQNSHPEFTPSPFVGTVPQEVPRSFYGKLTWNF